MIPATVAVALQVYSSARINGLSDADTTLRNNAVIVLVNYLASAPHLLAPVAGPLPSIHPQAHATISPKTGSRK